MKVHVYRNLRQDAWSVRVKGRVISVATAVLLAGVEFKIQPAGRARVRRERRKNVHAYAAGLLVDDGKTAEAAFEMIQGAPNTIGYRGEQVTYDPYGPGFFASAVDGRPISQADFALMDPDGKLRVWGAR